MTPEELQALEISPDIRIKFAAVQKDGTYWSGHLLYYPKLLAAIDNELAEWERVVFNQQPMIMTKYEHLRPAHVLRHASTEVAIVEHETGVELIAIAVIAGLTTEIITGLTVWSWKKWKQIKEEEDSKIDPKSEWAEIMKAIAPRIIVEQKVTSNAKGEKVEIRRTEFHNPTSEEFVSEQLKILFGKD